MFTKFPRHVPPLSVLLDDLGDPPLPDLARSLGVTLRTVQRWKRDDHAPRPVLLSLFWLTRWGSSSLVCDAQNLAALRHLQASALEQELSRSRRDVARLAALVQAQCETANAPTFAVPFLHAVGLSSPASCSHSLPTAIGCSPNP